MHLGPGILHFSELLKKIICAEAPWQSLKRELKQHIRKIGPLLLPDALDILLKNEVSSNINPSCWHNTVPLSHDPGKGATPFTQAHVWPCLLSAPETDSQVPWGSTKPWATPFCTVSTWHSGSWSGLLGFHPLVWDLHSANFHFLPSQFVCSTSPVYIPCIIQGKRPWINAAEFLFFGHPSTSPQTTSSVSCDCSEGSSTTEPPR